MKDIKDIIKEFETKQRRKIRSELMDDYFDDGFTQDKLIKTISNGEDSVRIYEKENGDVYFDGKFIERIKLNEKLLYGWKLICIL
jgi:hypothetical protein